MTTQAQNDRFMRQLGIYNPGEHAADKVTMIGCGGIGSFTALGLAKLGVPHVVLIDGDTVEDHNVPNQMFTTDDIAHHKVDAAAGLMRLTNEFANIESYAFKLPNDAIPPLDGLVISGLDSMSARKEIWEQCIKLKPGITRYIDARLSGEFIIAYCVDPTNMQDCAKYEEQALFDDGEAEELLCTERGIIDVGLQVASLLVRATRKHFNGDELPSITMMNQASYVTTQGAWVGDD